jgi:hypothetical protein
MRCSRKSVCIIGRQPLRPATKEVRSLRVQFLPQAVVWHHTCWTRLRFNFRKKPHVSPCYHNHNHFDTIQPTMQHVSTMNKFISWVGKWSNESHSSSAKVKLRVHGMSFYPGEYLPYWLQSVWRNHNSERVDDGRCGGLIYRKRTFRGTQNQAKVY